MSVFQVRLRNIRRSKFLMVVATLCLVIHFLHDGLFMVKVKLKHPRQYLIKMTAWPSFIQEYPDVEEQPEGTTLKLCPKKSPHLEGYLSVNESLTDLESLTRKYFPYRSGGHFKPQDCVSRTKTAVVVPYRNRQRHLLVLLNHLIPFLVRQQAEFAIFVVEPVANMTFNRALLMNIGFVEALKTNNFTCFIFHDVDEVPESDANLYRCGATPRHMAVATSRHYYNLQYHAYAGGIVAMARDIYVDVNGHSNLYFGWGGEDDDLLNRLTRKNYKISRYPHSIARYTSIFHTPDIGNDVSHIRYQLLWTSEERLEADGLTSLRYKLVKLETPRFYTRILVDVDMEYYKMARE